MQLLAVEPGVTKMLGTIATYYIGAALISYPLILKRITTVRPDQITPRSSSEEKKTYAIRTISCASLWFIMIPIIIVAKRADRHYL